MNITSLTHKKKQQENPFVGNIFCGDIIQRCWNSGYTSMDALNREAHLLLGGTTLQGQLESSSD